LLRLLTGISSPTHGEIDVNYRMSAILELGSGFHPEFSGRDNVFLGGAVLGMDEAEVRRKYDGIVAFAELEPYMDLPFKTYSLGMQARLSFAVAISVEPEILVIDEALAAGDSAFIAKCFERIREICASGATVLFVSHNTYLVQRLCGRALWIDAGSVQEDGDPAYVCRDYEVALRRHEDGEREARLQLDRRRFSDDVGAASPGAAAIVPQANDPASSQPRVGEPAPGEPALVESDPRRSGHTWGTGEVRFTAVELLDGAGNPAGLVYSGDPLTIRLHYQGDAPYDDLAVVVQLARSDGIVACSLDAREAGIHLPSLHGAGTFEVTLDPLLLGRGRYFVSPHIYRDRSGVVGQADVLEYHDRIYEIAVERRGRPYDVAVEQPARWRHVADT
ncbi:MAG: ABC transporter ATP-binding protein, partial [Chloroflexota bacterium]|nr:ABC transporter ATP-binding protein [Chloroflexota bacterium]